MKNRGDEMTETTNAQRSYWFVGASYGGTEDQTPRFRSEGIWENGYDDKRLDLVRSMQPGDRIAIKSSFTRKHNLPFDNRGKTVSVMAIKAIGKVIKGLLTGQQVPACVKVLTLTFQSTLVAIQDRCTPQNRAATNPNSCFENNTRYYSG